jgi:hypothetical protein
MTQPTDCKCPEEIKTGWTEVKCCNICGKSVEPFWNAREESEWVEKPFTEFPTEDGWYVVFCGSRIPSRMWFDTELKWDIDAVGMGKFTSWLRPPTKLNQG